MRPRYITGAQVCIESVHMTSLNPEGLRAASMFFQGEVIGDSITSPYPKDSSRLLQIFRGGLGSRWCLWTEIVGLPALNCCEMALEGNMHLLLLQSYACQVKQSAS